MPFIDIPFKGFYPDYPDNTPNIITECRRFIPTKRGYIGAPGIQDVGMDALASRCTGAAVVVKLDDSNRLIAGTATKLYERSGTSWTDRSTGTYNSSADIPWTFAQVGNVTLATNKGDTIQASTSTTFAPISGAPKAAIIETVGEFVMAFDVDDGVNDYPDGWHCSALGNYTDWTESVSTQSASGRLLDIPGRNKAAKRLGSNIIAYKERGAFIGTYVGGDVIWAWQLIPGTVGAVSPYAVVEVNINGSPAHIVMGSDDFYMFDGSRPVSIGEGIRKFYQSRASAEFLYRSFAVHDPLENTIRFYFDTDEDGDPDESLVYNYYTNQWGSEDTVEPCMALQYVGDGITWHDMGTLYSTWNNLPTDISYDSPFWSAGRAVPAVFNISDNKLYSYTAEAGGSDFKTSFVGDPPYLTTPQYVWMVLSQNNLSFGFFDHYFRETNAANAGDPGGLDGSFEFDYEEGRADGVQISARMHAFSFFNLLGDYAITGLKVEYKRDGMR